MEPLSLDLRLGKFQVHLVQDGSYRLDGGAMFGVVPKVLWERRFPADEANRIGLGLNSLLIRTPEALVLVEAGIGGALDAKERDFLVLEQPHPLPERLARLGVSPAAVDHVVLTHLNFDHIGHCARPGPAGSLVPTFPNARHHVQRQELVFALDPPPRLRAAYPLAVIQPLRKAGLLEVHEGPGEVVPGIRLVPTGGHTPGHQLVLVEEGGRRLVFWGDLVPTSRHLDVGYGMGYDLFPLDVMRRREELVNRSVEEDWIHTFPHEPEMHFLRVRRGKKHFETQVVRCP